MTHHEIQARNNATIRLIGTIQGLKSERDKVRSAFQKKKPDAIALGVSEAYLKTLGQCSISDDVFDDISGLEEIYLKKLSEYGPIDLPPAELIEALKLSIENNVPLVALDLDDDSCMKAYTGSLTKWPLVFSTFFAPFRIRRMRKREFRAKSAQEFVLEFDELRRKIRGFRRLEDAREAHMAARLKSLADEHKNIMAIIETQRLRGVSAALEHQ